MNSRLDSVCGLANLNCWLGSLVQGTLGDQVPARDVVKSIGWFKKRHSLHALDTLIHSIGVDGIVQRQRRSFVRKNNLEVAVEPQTHTRIGRYPGLLKILAGSAIIPLGIILAAGNFSLMPERIGVRVIRTGEIQVCHDGLVRTRRQIIA